MKKLFGILVASLFLLAPILAQAAPQQAIFAGGCFWCMESDFKHVKGVRVVESGYTGGHVKNPSYEEVSSGTTGHVEAVRVRFDDAQVSYDKLLETFWDNVDPTDDKGQFCDKGSQYRAGIFVASEAQKKAAAASLAAIQAKYRAPVATVIQPAGEFYPAEEHHQNYAEKNALHYTLYRAGCGRDARIKQLKDKQ